MSGLSFKHLRVQLNLVDSRCDGGNGEQAVEELDGEVGDTDGFELIGVSLVQSLHLLPSIEPVNLATL